MGYSEVPFSPENFGSQGSVRPEKTREIGCG